MKKRTPFSVVSILALVFTQIIVTSSDVSSYDLVADINRDRIVDAKDLTRLGNAYGASLVLPSEPGKTTVTVFSFNKEPPEVENARVAIIDPEACGDAVNVTYTNSSGMATFDLSPNKNYTAIAWRDSAYNYADFATNPLGEASVLILLGEPSPPPIRELPNEWVIVTLLNNDTGLIHYEFLAIRIYSLEYVQYEGWQSNLIWAVISNGGVIVVPPSLSVNDPHSGRGVRLIDPDGNHRGSCTFSADEEGCANVILYVTPP